MSRLRCWSVPALGLAVFAVGLAHLSPTVDFGDAGEFTAAAATLSLAHPPAFPLYALLGKAATLVPLANLAYRTNLLSLALGSAAVAALAAAIVRMGFGLGPALLGAAVFAAAPGVLHEFLVTEVFALNAFLAAAGLWLVFAHERPTGPSGLAALGLLLGLAAGNHHTLALVVPALAAAALLRGGPPSGRALLAASAAFALGLGVYAYLPLRSAHHPPLDWGHPTTLARLLRVFFRRDYGSLSLTVDGPQPHGLAAAAAQAARFARVTFAQFGPAGCALAAAGLLGLRETGPRRRALLAALAWLVLAGPFFLALGNPPFTPELEGALSRFYMLPWMGLAVLAASAARLARRAGPAAWLLWLAPLWIGAAGRPAWSLRWNLAAYDYGRGLLRSLPPGTAFYMDGGDDSFYTTAYLLYAEGRRADLEPHDRGGLVFPSAYGPDFRSLPKARKEERRREVEARADAAGRLRYATMNPDLLPGRRLLPLGLVQRPAPPDAHLAPADLLWPFYVFRYDPDLGREHYRHRALAPYYPYMRGWAEAELGRTDAALRRWSLAAELGPDVPWLRANLSHRLDRMAYDATVRGDWPGAERLYRFRLTRWPASAAGWANLGVVLEKLGRLHAAENADRMALGQDPEFAQAYYNIGVLMWRQERWDDAVRAFERAVAFDPQPAWRHFLEGARRRAEGR